MSTEGMIRGIIIYDKQNHPVSCTCIPSDAICDDKNCPRNKNIDHEYDDMIKAATYEALHPDKH
jgi:hypothetical protein